MTNEERIEELSRAFIRLTAKVEAMEYVCKAMLPLIPTEPAMRGAWLTRVFDAATDANEQDGTTDEYRQTVLAAIESWWSLINDGAPCALGYKAGDRQSPDQAPQ